MFVSQMMVRIQSIILILAIALLASACSAEPERVVEESWNEETPRLVAFYSEDESGARVKVREEKYYQDGKLEYEGGYDENNMRQGEWKYYYPNGNLWSVGNFVRGVNEGRKEVYWPDGNIRYDGYFTQDEKTGIWNFYSKDGKMIQTKEFGKKAE